MRHSAASHCEANRQPRFGCGLRCRFCLLRYSGGQLASKRYFAPETFAGTISKPFKPPIGMTCSRFLPSRAPESPQNNRSFSDLHLFKWRTVACLDQIGKLEPSKYSNFEGSERAVVECSNGFRPVSDVLWRSIPRPAA